MIKKIVLLFILVLGLLISCNSNNSKTVPSMNQPVPGLDDVDETIVESDNSADVSAQLPEVSVAIQGSKFSQQNLKIKLGTKVTWTNMDQALHNVKSSDRTLDSPDLFKGDSWSFTFTTKGTYNYICSKHSSMKGSITVE